VLLGATFGALILVGFRRTPLPDPAGASASGRASLPAAYWAFWALLATVVALEFCVLIWAPEFLERVAGQPHSSAGRPMRAAASIANSTDWLSVVPSSPSSQRPPGFRCKRRP
jgi:hypothetical protein